MAEQQLRNYGDRPAITIGLHQHISGEDCEDVVRAIRKTAASAGESIRYERGE